MKYLLFGFQTSTEYEYEYYSGLENHANTNTNIFGFEKSSEYEYEYYSVWKYLPNTNTNITIRSQLFEYYSNTELFAHLWALSQWIPLTGRKDSKSSTTIPPLQKSMILVHQQVYKMI